MTSKQRKHYWLASIRSSSERHPIWQGRRRCCPTLSRTKNLVANGLTVKARRNVVIWYRMDAIRCPNPWLTGLPSAKVIIADNWTTHTRSEKYSFIKEFIKLHLTDQHILTDSPALPQLSLVWKVPVLRWRHGRLNCENLQSNGRYRWNRRNLRVSTQSASSDSYRPSRCHMPPMKSTKALQFGSSFPSWRNPPEQPSSHAYACQDQVKHCKKVNWRLISSRKLHL